MTPIELMLKEYNDQSKPPTEKQKAEIEAAIWSLVTDRAAGRRVILSQMLGTGQHELDGRMVLHRAGSAADPLWERLHNKTMPLRTAMDLLREAREKARKTSRSLGDVVSEMVVEYDSRPFTKHQPGGGTVRTGRPSKSRRSHGTQSTYEADRVFWRELRENITPYVRKKLESLDPIVSEEVYSRFETDMKILMDETQSRISKLVNDAKYQNREKNKYLERDQVRFSCHVLAIDPPVFGRPVNLIVAQRQKKRLAQQYHPDKHGGDEGLRHKYEEVLEAYATLERYNARFSSPTGEAPHGGNQDGSR